MDRDHALQTIVSAYGREPRNLELLTDILAIIEENPGIPTNQLQAMMDETSEAAFFKALKNLRALNLITRSNVAIELPIKREYHIPYALKEGLLTKNKWQNLAALLVKLDDEMECPGWEGMTVAKVKEAMKMFVTEDMEYLLDLGSQFLAMAAFATGDLSNFKFVKGVPRLISRLDFKEEATALAKKRQLVG